MAFEKPYTEGVSFCKKKSLITFRFSLLWLLKKIIIGKTFLPLSA